MGIEKIVNRFTFDKVKLMMKHQVSFLIFCVEGFEEQFLLK